MSHAISLVSCAIIAATSFGIAAFQDSKKPEAGGMEMGAPQPTPHHAHLKAHEGTWESTIKMMMPGMPPSESKGTETNTMLSGLWLLSDMKSEMMGMPFVGHSITGYDTAKGKYVGVWVDSMGTALSHGEGTCDGSGKVLTMTWEGPDPSGKMMKWRQTDEMKDADTRVFTMYMPGSEGKDAAPMMTIHMKRKK